MDKRRIDDAIKLLNGKIDFFILQNNAISSKYNNPDSCSDSLDVEGNNCEVGEKHVLGELSNAKYDELINFSEKCIDYEEIKCMRKKEREEEREDALNYQSETSSHLSSSGTAEDHFEDMVNWKFCGFSTFNVNICNLSSDDSFNDIIKEFHKIKIEKFKKSYERYYSIDEFNNFESYTTNFCIMEALRKNRIDLLMNKLKNWKILCKIENVVLDNSVHLENYINANPKISDNVNDVYMLLRYPNIFSNYYFIDVNDFFRKKETKREFIKDAVSIKVAFERKKKEWEKKYKHTIMGCNKNSKREISSNNEYNKEESIQIENCLRKNTKISVFKNKEACLNFRKSALCSYLHTYYLRKRNRSPVNCMYVTPCRNKGFYDIHNYKKWKETKLFINLWKKFYFDADYLNIVTEYMFRKERAPPLNRYILRVTKTNKYKKKEIMDYNFVYKEVSKNISAMTLNCPKRNKRYISFDSTFPYSCTEVRATDLKHYMTFPFIGEDYNFFEIPDVIYNKKEKMIYFLPSMNEDYVVPEDDSSFFFRYDDELCLPYFTCNQKRKEVARRKMNCSNICEQGNRSINENGNSEILNSPYNPNEKEKHIISNVCYNYFDNTIMVCSQDYIYIYDINCSTYKKKILLLNEFQKRIGEMTAVCYLHAFMDNVENHDETSKADKRNISESKCGTNSFCTGDDVSCSSTYLRSCAKQNYFVNRFFSNYDKKRKNIFFIGTKEGNIYMYDESHERIDKSNTYYIICMDSFTTMKNFLVTQLYYYEDNGRHSIIASSVNDVFIRLYPIRHLRAIAKQKESKNDNGSYIKNKENCKDDEDIIFYRENRDDQKYYFDILHNFLFTGDMYGNVLIYNINDRSLFFKKKLSYAPIVCISINKVLPLMLMATAYNASHFLHNVLYDINKKLLFYERVRYKNNYAKESKKPIFITCLSLWFIYELLNLYV